MGQIQPILDEQAGAFLVLVRTDDLTSNHLARKYVLDERGMSIDTAGGTHGGLAVPTGNSMTGQVFFRRSQGAWLVENRQGGVDLYVNGVLSNRITIQDGDILRMGSLAFEVCLEQGMKANFFHKVYDSMQRDVLTQVYNRRFLHSLLDWEVARQNERPVGSNRKQRASDFPNMALVMLDIDNFGMINKTMGQLAGDVVLCQVVARMLSCVRSTDVVARIGGEEFVVFLPDTDLSAAMTMAETIRSQLAQSPFPIAGQSPLSVTASFGVGCFEHGMDTTAFLDAANKNMLTAKKSGKNKVVG